MNLSELVRAARAADGRKPALIPAAGGDPVDYARFDAEVDRVAGHLRGRGLAPGDRVVVAMPNSPAFCFAYFGILRAGGIAVPVDPELSGRELRRILEDCEPALAVSAGGALPDGAPCEVIDGDDPGSFGPLPDGPVEPVGGGDDLAVLAYTSGTTGEPRAAMLTHANLVSSLHQQQQILGGKVARDDVVLMVPPFFHIFGLNVVLGLTVQAGATGVVVASFEPAEALELIARHRVTVLIGAPTMYAALAAVPGAGDHDLSGVRLAVSGAAPLAPGVLDAFRKTFGIDIYEGYGLTETSPSLTSNRLDGAPRPGSVGKPLPGVQLRIVDERGADVDVGDVGEVVVRGPNVTRGYWRRPADDEDAFIDGWFRTGDIGLVDEDGYLYLVDRKRDLIIVSGFNVFPSEVEEVLLQHPGVAQAAVTGEPHAVTGEAVVAYVVPAHPDGIDVADLRRHCAANLARYKVPADIRVVDDLPHLPGGKVFRRGLRT